MFLVGDIGGTKTNLAVVSEESGARAPLAEASFTSTSYPSLEAVIRDFLREVALPVDRAGFGVAGPVVGGRARITNLPWVIEEERLCRTLNLKSVHILNDLEALAHAVPSLESRDVYVLHAGKPAPKGNLAVIAPGTGLGEAFLTWDGSRYRPSASEGGHTDFAPRNELEMGLLAYLQRQFDHVSYERVCSGLGLPNIYAYLRDAGHATEPPWLSEELSRAEDPAPIIVNAALEQAASCELCERTLDLFVSILGAEAANLALKVLATGGVYLGGGIPPRILPFLEKGSFLESFRIKGRMSGLASMMPVHVILNPKAALLGAAHFVLHLAGRRRQEG